MLYSVSLANYLGMLKDEWGWKKALCLLSFRLEIFLPKWKIKWSVINIQAWNISQKWKSLLSVFLYSVGVTQYFCISENDGETFTLSEAVEAIGMGKFQILLILMAGFVNVSMGLKLYFLQWNICN